MRRPAHRGVSGGRSAGVAEHRMHTGLSQPIVTRIVAVASICALALLPAVARADTTNDRVAQTRHTIDAVAQKWFQAQAQAASIDARIADIEHRLADAQARVNRTRGIATARAVMLYKTNDLALTSVFGTDALDSARRAELANQANDDSESAISDLVAAMSDLQAQRQALETQRDHQRKIIADVAKERDALDAQLAGLRAQARREAEAAVAHAITAGARAHARVRLSSFATVTTDAAPAASAATAAPTAPTPPIVRTYVSAPGSGGGGGGAHHDDPFLVCTRARESGGIYSINTGNGYYGAYQFLPSTWDAAAAHGGLMNLVGLLPSNASPAAQDDVAWILYQWQGKSPWGGRC